MTEELLPTLLSVSLVWAVAVTTPGPNFLLTVQTAVGISYRSAMFVVLGIGTGTIVWAIFGFLGIQFLSETAPWIYFTLKFLGGGYLIYLGILHIYRGPKKSLRTPLSTVRRISAGQFFLSGLLTNLSNPKSAAFVTTLFAATMPANPSYLIGFMCVATMSLISTCWYSLIAFTFSLQNFRDISSKVRLITELIAGAVFIGFGIHLLTSL